MVFLDLLYALFIGPLELFFEVIYAIAYRFVEDPGLTIVFLSLAMNFLVLPLYRRADAMQEAERERAMKMKPWTDHIKKTFKGDERFMVLQTYNRQCGYKPTDALKGSVSLLLEIPFFIAAYHFLSNLQLLNGVSFGPIADLGAPDALISLGGGLTLNALPILMTALNLMSAVIYMKGLPLSNKIQMYGIAAIFLVLLYNSPSGLVFYWTLNNVFSLVKNVFYRLKNPGLVLCALASIAGVVLLAYCLVRPMPTNAKQAFCIGAGLALQLPMLWRLLKSRRKLQIPIREASRSDGQAFLASALLLALLTGALIPLSVVQASPTEFINVADYTSPLWYVAHSLAVAVGTFVIWFGVFYWLMSPRGRVVFNCVMFASVGMAIVDYLFFVPELGNLSPNLQYGNTLVVSLGPTMVNLLAVVAVASALIVLYLLKGSAARVICTSLCVATVVISGMGAIGVNQDLASISKQASISQDGSPHVSLSKNGKNVVVIMMDRAIGYYLPYLLNESPGLQEQLQGFTYYPNAVSYGIYTNFGAPGLYGGYDYTPENMNARNSVSLGEKHDEALKVMPTVFLENGFEATFFDPTYAGYSTTPNLSVFDDMPDLNVYITMDGTWDTREGLTSSPVGEAEADRKRNFFCYSIFRIAPIALRPTVYHNGDYNSTSVLSRLESTIQVAESSSRSEGLDAAFMTSYSALQHLPDMATVEEGDQNTLFIMSNDTTHSPTVLKEPEYIPAVTIDNTEFDEEHKKRQAADGSYIELPEEAGNKEASPTMHYEINMAALRELCNWFDYLRENDAWDNTRIIVVSDHGRDLRLFDDMIVTLGNGDLSLQQDLLMANCFLMVKDFDSNEFTVDEQFMTNADTPALAMEGVIENPTNPYTGNPITIVQKQSGANVLFSHDWDTAKNNGNEFLPGYWVSVHDDIFDSANWEYLGYY